MRLRNVKNKDIILKSCPNVLDNPCCYKGKFSELFNNSNEIHLEIGIGKGKFIKTLALNNPSINYIGLEKQDSVLALAVRDEHLPSNLILMNYDAKDIGNLFDKEIDMLYLNFSDPWPKKRHAKRRLTSPFFLEIYDKIFKNSCKIQFKTDNRELFEYSLKSFVDHGYKIEKISLDLQNDDSFDNILTEYEEKFIKKGARIYMVFVYKN